MMIPELFVKAILDDVLDSNVRFYRKTLEKPDGATDPYWLAISEFYARSTPADRELLVRMMQQAVIDTISNLFGVLDGSSTLEGFGEDFVLRYGKRPGKLNGDLQDLFLAEIEERGL